MLLVNSKTGEVSYSLHSKFKRESEGLDVGSMIIQNYGFRFNPESMQMEVVETDKEDRQALIDSYADECGVYNILKKYALTGDVSLLNQRELQYGDISDLPVDELNPAALQEAANASLAALNAKFGLNLTAEQLSSMTQDQILALLTQASVQQTTGSTEPKESEGE